MDTRIFVELAQKELLPCPKCGKNGVYCFRDGYISKMEGGIALPDSGFVTCISSSCMPLGEFMTVALWQSLPRQNEALTEQGNFIGGLRAANVELREQNVKLKQELQESYVEGIKQTQVLLKDNERLTARVKELENPPHFDLGAYNRALREKKIFGAKFEKLAEFLHESKRHDDMKEIYSDRIIGLAMKISWHWKAARSSGSSA